jgi:heptosyltransferase-2
MDNGQGGTGDRHCKKKKADYAKKMTLKRYPLQTCYPRAKLLALIELAASQTTRLIFVGMKIAIFLPNWIGDVVMATPTLQAVRQHFSQACLLGVMRPYVADVLGGTNWLDRQFFYDPRSRDPALRSRFLVRQLRQERPEMVLLLPNSLRTGILAWLSGAKKRIGYAQYGRGPLLTDKLKFRKNKGRFAPASTMDSYLELAGLMGCRQTAFTPYLETLPKDERAADDIWHRLKLPPGKQVVVFHNAAGWGGQASAKLWPHEYAAELAHQLATRLGLSVLLLCGPRERAAAADIALRAAHPDVKSLADQPLSIGLSKACVRRSRLMISSDSGPRHFAAAFGVPVITLYGPTHTAWGDTHYAQAIDLQQQVPCGPCMRRTCPLGHHRCMRELTVDRVYKTVLRQIQNPAITAPHWQQAATISA